MAIAALQLGQIQLPVLAKSLNNINLKYALAEREIPIKEREISRGEGVLHHMILTALLSIPSS